MNRKEKTFAVQKQKINELQKDESELNKTIMSQRQKLESLKMAGMGINQTLHLL